MSRQTRKARRVLRFAKSEARRDGTDRVEPKHLLLGLLEADPGLVLRFLPSGTSTSALRESLTHPVSDQSGANTSQVQVSDETRSVLQRAEQEKARLSHQHLGTEHLLLALLQHKSPPGEILRSFGLKISEVQRQLGFTQHNSTDSSANDTSSKNRLRGNFLSSGFANEA